LLDLLSQAVSCPNQLFIPVAREDIIEPPASTGPMPGPFEGQYTGSPGRVSLMCADEIDEGRSMPGKPIQDLLVCSPACLALAYPLTFFPGRPPRYGIACL